MKRHGQLIGLRPEHYGEYVKAHADVWPGVLAMIHEGDRWLELDEVFHVD